MRARARPGLAAALLGVLAACGGGDEAPPLWGAEPSRPLDLRAALDRTEVVLLEEVALRVDLFVGDGLEVAFAPAIPEGFEGSVEKRAPHALDGGTWRRFVLRLRPTELGELTIPAFRAEAGGGGPVATSAALTLTVGSALAGSEAGSGVEPPAPPFPPPADPWPWLLAGAAALALTAAALLWRRRQPAVRRGAATPVPAHVKALRALARLRSASRSTPAQVDAFYVEVSQILRLYLEERFGLHAPERTTDEFLAEVEGGSVLSAAQRARLSEFLLQCDLVKFARALPSEEVHERTFRTAEELVEATRPDRPVRAAEPEAVPGGAA